MTFHSGKQVYHISMYLAYENNVDTCIHTVVNDRQTVRDNAVSYGSSLGTFFMMLNFFFVLKFVSFFIPDLNKYNIFSPFIQ